MAALLLCLKKMVGISCPAILSPRPRGRHVATQFGEGGLSDKCRYIISLSKRGSGTWDSVPRIIGVSWCKLKIMPCPLAPWPLCPSSCPVSRDSPRLSFLTAWRLRPSCSRLGRTWRESNSALLNNCTGLQFVRNIPAMPPRRRCL